jgi:hypothetical protein
MGRYKTPRATCKLCGQEWSVRNVDPRYHHCPALPKRALTAPPPTPVIEARFNVSMGVDDLRRTFDAEQLQALMGGIAACLSAQRAAEVATPVDAVARGSASQHEPSTRDESSSSESPSSPRQKE